MPPNLETIDPLVEPGWDDIVATHPDGSFVHTADEYPAGHYADFLDHVRREYKGQYWNALPREVPRHIRMTPG
jgi:hypothetical protein